MSYVHRMREPARMPHTASPLILCDRLLTLAEDADRAGFAVAAEHLLFLAYDVLEQPRPLA